jgi:hypothetical protein
MKNFLTDLWHDLRAKRLWPVAVLLLGALVAVPVVLTKSSQEPPAEAPAASDARTAPEPRELDGLAAVKLADDAGATGSSLSTFDPDDPFRPPAKVVSKAEESQASAGESGPEPASSSAQPSSTNGSSGSDPTGGDTASTGAPGASQPPTGGTPDAGHGKTRTTEYAYVIDVTFAANGRTRKLKGMRRLDMLPSQASPLLLFLGVSSNAGNAVFLVDSTLDAAGEGSCKPSNRDCAFLHLGAGSEHVFTTEDGDTYELRVDEIRKVRVGEPSAAASSRRPAKARATAAASSRRFVSPLISDLVTVSSQADADSDRDQDRR